MLNILAVNLGVTFLRIQCMKYDLLVLRPSIDFSRARTSDWHVTSVLGDIDRILARLKLMDVLRFLTWTSMAA